MHYYSIHVNIHVNIYIYTQKHNYLNSYRPIILGSKVCIVVRRKLGENWIHVDISFLPEKSTSSRCAII